MKSQDMALARIKVDLSKLTTAVPTLAHANGAGRIFELYLMMRLARKLKDGGWVVTPLDHTGNPIVGGPFVQRSGIPTGVFPLTAPSGPSSICFRRTNLTQAYEILNGIQFKGRSTALHEIDIAVVPVDITNTLRAAAIEGYPLGRPCIAIECKDVEKNGSPDEMRSVIARMYDLTILNGHRAHLFGGALPSGAIFACAPPGPWKSHGQNAKTFLEENKRALCVLARRTGITAGAYAMTGLFHVHTYTDVDRGTQGAKDFIDDTVNWMAANL